MLSVTKIPLCRVFVGPIKGKQQDGRFRGSKDSYSSLSSVKHNETNTSCWEFGQHRTFYEFSLTHKGVTKSFIFYRYMWATKIKV